MIFDLLTEFAALNSALPSGHPRSTLCALLEETLRREAHFLDRHPTALYQCMVNVLQWQDLTVIDDYFETSTADGSKIADDATMLPVLLRAWAGQARDTLRLTLRAPLGLSLGGAQLAVLRGHERAIICVAFSPDGQRLATGGTDTTARVWDLHDGREVTCFRGHDHDVTALRFTPDGRRVISTARDATVLEWDAATGQQIARLADAGNDHAWNDWPNLRRQVGSQQDITSADGHWRAVTDGNDVILSDPRTNTVLHRCVGHERPVTCCAFRADGRLLVTGSADMTIRTWDTAIGRALGCFRGAEGGILGVAISPTGHRVASVGNELGIRLWDTRRPAPRPSRCRHDGRVISVAFSPDGERAASISEWGDTRLWNVADGRLIHRLGHVQIAVPVRVPGKSDDPPRKARYNRKIVFLPDGRLVVPTYQQQLLSFDGQTGTMLDTLGPTPFVVWGIAVAPDGTGFALASGQGDVVLWHAGVSTHIGRLPTGVSSLAFTPDGAHLACGGDQKVYIIHLVSQRIVGELDGHGDVVWRSAFTPDGRTLVTTCWDEQMRIWDWETGTCRATIPGRGDPHMLTTDQPWRAFWRGIETVIEGPDQLAVAWLAAPLRDLQAHPSAPIWAGCLGEQVCIVALSGDEAKARPRFSG